MSERCVTCGLPVVLSVSRVGGSAYVHQASGRRMQDGHYARPMPSRNGSAGTAEMVVRHALTKAVAK